MKRRSFFYCHVFSQGPMTMRPNFDSLNIDFGAQALPSQARCSPRAQHPRRADDGYIDILQSAYGYTVPNNPLPHAGARESVEPLNHNENHFPGYGLALQEHRSGSTEAFSTASCHRYPEASSDRLPRTEFESLETSFDAGHSIPNLLSAQEVTQMGDILSSAACEDMSMFNNRQFYCWLHGCNGRAFTNISNYRRHCRERSHDHTKPTCPRCGKQFLREAARDSHFYNRRCKVLGVDANGVVRWAPMQ